MISYPSPCRAVAIATMLILSTAHLAAQWRELPPTDVDRASPQLAYLDGTLYLFGGFSFSHQNGAVTSARAFDVAQGTWRPIADMPEPRANGYAAAIGGKIYILGGTQGPELATQVLEYDPATDSYARRAPMPTPTFSFAGAVVGGTIYVIGGIPANGTRASPTQAVQAYDVAADRWTAVADLPYATSNFTATSIGNSIYVMGGSIVPPTLNHRYTYRGEVGGDGAITWRRVADIPDSLTYTTSGAAKGNVILAGGFNQQGRPTHDVYSYDPVADRWSRSYPLPIDGASSAISMPGDGTTIYYAGGVFQRRAFAFNGGDPMPILSLDQHDFFATARTGGTVPMLIRIANDGILPLDGAIEIPDGIAWLAPSHLQLAAVPPLSASTVVLTAGAPSLPAGDYVTTATLKSNDPARPETPLRLHLFVRDTIPLQPLPLVIEEAAGNWNGWEPDARGTLDSIRMLHPESTIILAYHGPADSFEPMAINHGDETLAALGLRTFPSASVRRVAAPGEELPMMADRSMWGTEAERQLALVPNAPVRIDVDGFSYDPANRNLVAQVRVTTTNGLIADTSVAYRVTAIVIEDSLSYPQTRYVLKGDGSTTTEQIADYPHRGVVRMIWPDESGRELTPPEEAIHDNWIGPGARLDQEIAFNVWRGTSPYRMTAVLLVHAMRHGKLAEILNAWWRPLQAMPSGVDGNDVMIERMTMEVAPNPASGVIGITYALPRRGDVTIELSSVAGARLHAIDAGMMEAGDHAAEIDISHLPAGIYLLRLSANGSSMSKVVTVVR